VARIEASEPGPAFLIAAARQAVKRSSIRAVAAQAGMSPGGLHNLVTGKSRHVHGTTITRLRSWYLRECAACGDSLTPEAASYLVQQLLAMIDDGERSCAELELLGALERIYDSRGMPRPAWLGPLANEDGETTGDEGRTPAPGRVVFRTRGTFTG